MNTEVLYNGCLAIIVKFNGTIELLAKMTPLYKIIIPCFFCLKYTRRDKLREEITQIKSSSLGGKWRKLQLGRWQYRRKLVAYKSSR